MTSIPELLAPIRELETAATEGPWRWTDLGSKTRQELRNAERPLLRCSALMHPEPEDAAFIAASRTTVPRLVAALEAVEALAEKWQEDFPDKADKLRAAVVAALGGEA